MIYPKTQRVCAWSGILSVMLFFAAFLLAGFIPPPGPYMTEAEVVAMYQQNTTGIRLGMGLMLLSSGFYLPFSGVIATQMKRIEGDETPLLTYIQLAAGTFAAITYFLPALLFIVTSFRPERAPELTFLMNDLSFIVLIIPLSPFLIQYFAIGVVILRDQRKQPIFPRWLAFFNFWAAISFFTALFLPFFKTGPFAWNGLLVFWIPATLFFIWYILMAAMLLKAINRQEQEAVVATQ